MRWSGWIFMIFSWTAIISLMVLAYGKILSVKKKKNGRPFHG